MIVNVYRNESKHNNRPKDIIWLGVSGMPTSKTEVSLFRLQTGLAGSCLHAPILFLDVNQSLSLVFLLSNSPRGKMESRQMAGIGIGIPRVGVG